MRRKWSSIAVNWGKLFLLFFLSICGIAISDNLHAEFWKNNVNPGWVVDVGPKPTLSSKYDGWDLHPVSLPNYLIASYPSNREGTIIYDNTGKGWTIEEFVANDGDMPPWEDGYKFNPRIGHAGGSTSQNIFGYEGKDPNGLNVSTYGNLSLYVVYDPDLVYATKAIDPGKTIKKKNGYNMIIPSRYYNEIDFWSTIEPATYINNKLIYSNKGYSENISVLLDKIESEEYLIYKNRTNMTELFSRNGWLYTMRAFFTSSIINAKTGTIITNSTNNTAILGEFNVTLKNYGKILTYGVNSYGLAIRDFIMQNATDEIYGIYYNEADRLKERGNRISFYSTVVNSGSIVTYGTGSYGMYALANATTTGDVKDFVSNVDYRHGYLPNRKYVSDSNIDVRMNNAPSGVIETYGKGAHGVAIKSAVDMRRWGFVIGPDAIVRWDTYNKIDSNSISLVCPDWVEVIENPDVNMLTRRAGSFTNYGTVTAHGENTYGVYLEFADFVQRAGKVSGTLGAFYGNDSSLLYIGGELAGKVKGTVDLNSNITIAPVAGDVVNLELDGGFRILNKTDDGAVRIKGNSVLGGLWRNNGSLILPENGTFITASGEVISYKDYATPDAQVRNGFGIYDQGTGQYIVYTDNKSDMMFKYFDIDFPMYSTNNTDYPFELISPGFDTTCINSSRRYYFHFPEADAFAWAGGDGLNRIPKVHLLKSGAVGAQFYEAWYGNASIEKGDLIIDEGSTFSIMRSLYLEGGRLVFTPGKDPSAYQLIVGYEYFQDPTYQQNTLNLTVEYPRNSSLYISGGQLYVNTTQIPICNKTVYTFAITPALDGKNKDVLPEVMNADFFGYNDLYGRAIVEQPLWILNPDTGFFELKASVTILYPDARAAAPSAIASAYGQRGSWLLAEAISNRLINRLSEGINDGSKDRKTSNYYYTGTFRASEKKVASDNDPIDYVAQQYGGYVGIEQEIANGYWGAFYGYTLRDFDYGLYQGSENQKINTIGGTFAYQKGDWLITDVLSASFGIHNTKRLLSGEVPTSSSYNSFNLHNDLRVAYLFDYDDFTLLPYMGFVADYVASGTHSDNILIEYSKFSKSFYRALWGMKWNGDYEVSDVAVKPFIDVSYSQLLSDKDVTINFLLKDDSYLSNNPLQLTDRLDTSKLGIEVGMAIAIGLATDLRVSYTGTFGKTTRLHGATLALDFNDWNTEFVLGYSMTMDYSNSYDYSGTKNGDYNTFLGVKINF